MGMENYLASITGYLWDQSWQIAVLAPVVAVVSILLKSRSAHIRYLLWLVLLAKCLVPPLFSVPLPILPEDQIPQRSIRFAIGGPPVSVTPAYTAMEEARATRPTPLAEPTALDRLSAITPSQWVGFAWVLGVLVLTLVAVTKASRVSRWLRQERMPVGAELQVEIGNLLSRLKVKPIPTVWLVDGISQPFVWGLLRGSIYLPRSFTEIRAEEHRQGILGHELGHVLRFDPAVNLLQIVAQTIYWFHPLVWWANKRIRAEREKCCDEIAVAWIGTKVKDFSTAVVNILTAEHESVRSTPSMAIAGPVKNIEDRIRTIMNPGRRFYRRPRILAIVTILLFAIVVVPTGLVLISPLTGMTAQKEADMADQMELTHGFRYDPMKWVENEKSVVAAQVRSFVLNRPKPGDKRILQEQIDEVLSQKKKGDDLETEEILYLLELGCPPQHPRIQQAIEHMIRNNLGEDNTLDCYGLQLLSMAGGDDADVTKVRTASMRKIIEHLQEVEPAECPATPAVDLKAIWAARGIGDIEGVMVAGLSWILDGLNIAGARGHKDPWDILDMAGYVDHPLGREIVVKQISMILRNQRPNGGWYDHHNLYVFRALNRYGLLDELQALPPLPPDWKIVRSIPAPQGKLYTMTWGNGGLWIYSDSHEAIAVSPQDGRVLKRVPMPGKPGEVRGIGWWEDSLLMVTTDKVRKIDPDTGRTTRELPFHGNTWEPGAVTVSDGKIWVTDTWIWLVAILDPDKPEQRRYGVLSGPCAYGDMATTEDGTWHFDYVRTGVMYKTDSYLHPMKWEDEPSNGVDIDVLHERPPIGGFRPAKLLDWGEHPFPQLAGLAFDGENLWALDNEAKRICVIEKNSD